MSENLASPDIANLDIHSNSTKQSQTEQVNDEKSTTAENDAKSNNQTLEGNGVEVLQGQQEKTGIGDKNSQVVKVTPISRPIPSILPRHVIPPLNFSMVVPGVYRSGYPKEMNHPFLKLLRLKTLIYLCPEDCNEANIDFCQANNITIMQFGIQGNKEPFTDIPVHVSYL